MAQHDQQNAVSSSVEAEASRGGRAPWTTPQVIVSDLSDARALSKNFGADGSFSGYTYGS